MTCSRWQRNVAGFAAAIVIVTPLAAATPRQILADAAYQTHDKKSALTQIAQSENGAEAILAGSPNDREANVVRAMAIGYRAKLTRSRTDALTARKLFEGLAAGDPRDPEAVMAVGAWHLDSVNELGSLLAGAALGAHKSAGIAAMDHAIALGGDRALFPGLAALFRLALDPQDAGARRLAEQASQGATPSLLDHIMQRSATAILVPLRAGNMRAVKVMAKQLLPFGRLAH